MLVDTGVLVALIDRDDPWHAAARDTFLAARLPVLTTWAVLAEAFYLAQKRGYADKMSGLVRKAVEIAPIETRELPAVLDLMARYADRPMDLADATLVHIATRERIGDILTIDHNDFETYRWARNRRFRIQPTR